MKIAILVWLGIGVLTNFYYHIKNAEKYAKLLQSGKTNIKSFIIGGFLTIFLWPISIYNNEIRRKKRD